MNCPSCNKDSRVTETRAVPGGMLRRRRACTSPECNARFSTIEAIVETQTRHSNAVVLVLPRHVARELRSALASLHKTLGPEPEPTEPAQDSLAT